MKTTSYKFLHAIALIMLAIGCADDPIDAPIKTVTPSTDPLNVRLTQDFQEPYGIAVRYEYVDRYVEGDKRVVPTKRELVEPMLDFLVDFWIEPFIEVENGEQFFKRYVPSEIVFIGSPIYNSDGTITLGTADAGARITLTQVNEIDIDNRAWVFLQLNTIYHEFAHIMHQNFNLPTNFQQISPRGYTSAGSWYTLNNNDALVRGFVSPYATSSFNEDFAETVAFLLFDPDFYEKYTIDETCTDADCEDRNAGRAMIRKKYAAILNHYEQHTGVDLLDVRALIQDKLN